MDEKVRSSWSLKAAQAGIAPQAASPLGLGAIAALPILPSAFSVAGAEQRRQPEPEKSGSVLAMDEAASPKPLDAAPVVMPMHAAPALASDAQALSQAPVRVSDLAPTQAEKDAPACRAGDPASTDRGQPLTAPRGEQDRTGAERPGGQETPLPHCIIEFDPDADDGDVVAHAPAPQTVQVVAKSASAVTQQAKAADAEQAAQAGAQDAETAPATAEAATSQAAEAPIAASPATPSLAEVQLAVTEATRGVGTAVIDPLVPLGSVVFGGDQSLPALAEAPLPAPATLDPVAESLAALGAGAQPDLFPALGKDIIFFT